MILKKVALPVGVDGKSYWEAMILWESQTTSSAHQGQILS